MFAMRFKITPDSFQRIRGATAPSKNGLSHANRTRNPKMAEQLFWNVLDHLSGLQQSFAHKSDFLRAMPRRFKRTIRVVDSTTIELVANSIDWAKHRRRKAAAKLHLSLDLQSFLPEVAIIDTASDSDSKRARELCANLEAGEIVVFDKAYVDYNHLYDLDQRGIFWVTRAKKNISCIVMKDRLQEPKPDVISDQEVLLDQKPSNTKYPKAFRCIEAWVEVDGKRRPMTFITNNLEWASRSICDLDKSRWNIEVFFKQIKQTLQLCDFLGHNSKAVRWQVWIALLVYVLMRFLAHQSQWVHSFTRLFTLVRGVLWDKYWLLGLLDRYGTAGGDFRLISAPAQAFLPGFEYMEE